MAPCRCELLAFASSKNQAGGVIATTVPEKTRARADNCNGLPAHRFHETAIARPSATQGESLYILPLVL
jgi:hypothetical protein